MATVQKENPSNYGKIAVHPRTSNTIPLFKDEHSGSERKVDVRRSLRTTVRPKRYCSETCGNPRARLAVAVCGCVGISEDAKVAPGSNINNPQLDCDNQTRNRKRNENTSQLNPVFCNKNRQSSKRRKIKEEKEVDYEKGPNNISVKDGSLNTRISQLGEDCLLYLFRFLPLPTLLKLRCVCKEWNQLSSHNTLWKRVSFDQALVVDWHKARVTLNQFQTTELDFHGLIYQDLVHQLCWPNILSALKKMPHVVSIHFGEVPSNVLLRVAHCMVQLRVLTASCIVETTTMVNQPEYVELDVGKLCLLYNLERLQLRAKLSMRLPAFSFCGGLKALMCLTRLKKLSLTSMVQVMQDEWGFLEHMSALQELQLGECSNWNQKIYGMLGNLKGLKYLRLENGGSLNDSDTCFTTNLAKLNRLQRLELIMFIIPHEMSAALTQLQQLQEFTVWPYCPDSPENMKTLNENTFKTVITQKHLLRFSWGILVRMTYESAMSQSGSCLVPWFTCICQTLVSETCPCSHKISIGEVTVMLNKELASTCINVFQVPMITSDIMQV